MAEAETIIKDRMGASREEIKFLLDEWQGTGDIIPAASPGEGDEVRYMIVMTRSQFDIPEQSNGTTDVWVREWGGSQCQMRFFGGERIVQ
eukprot:CAMPEP_0119126540 /NCGR_PEP_ID=MMETSP1310-20130426/5434_1 /TAXON_ID=464262 /ORGANISM="Genus nov. species nov., Strain RCC2339" /LENGTH=89 /DNA_ID=CAMNT_0007116705 /DNA_START=79 /DNA_END=345 /DNA_ORIENTATION=-